MKALRILLQRRAGNEHGNAGRRVAPPHRWMTAKDGLTLRGILALVPTTFTSASQLARAFERRLPGQSPAWNAERVHTYALAYPFLFDFRQVGSVVTIRRHDTALETLAQAEQSTQADLSLSNPNAPGLSESEINTLTRVFPTFCVPLTALVSAGSTEGTDVKHLIMTYRSCLSLQFPSGEEPSASEDLQTPPLPTTFVSLSPQFVQEYVRTSHALVGAVTPADTRWEAWRVEAYEWLRVARLLPTTREWVPLTANIVAAAQPLLPRNRDILHVLFSAPHLFRIRSTVTHDKHAACQPSHASTAAVPPLLSAHFQLTDTFVPCCGPLNGEVEMVQAELARLQSARHRKDARERRRELQRYLAFLQHPTPLLDECVLAQYVFDLLPAQGGVPVNNLLGGLPELVHNCLPPQLNELWGRDDLFYLYFNGVEMMVQRADAPRPTLRVAESVDPVEILQEVYQQFPLARHPDYGTCLFRLLPKLSPFVRERLFQLRDVEELILKRFPDKVEVLGVDSALMAHQLAACKGRTDFFVTFRFVGEWHERLLERFATFEAKRLRRRSPTAAS